MLNPPDSASQSEEGGAEFDFPDEIAVEILSRLPAIDVVRLRSVCRSWRDLTRTHNFRLLHLRRSLPMLLSQENCFDNDRELWGFARCLLDQWWEPLPKTPKIYQFGNVSEFPLLFSLGGLIVMGGSRDYIILNPMYHEKVRIKFSEELRIDDLYGVFLHPSLEEYCTLWRIAESSNYTATYKILTLGSKPSWRKINNPWSHNVRIRNIPPVLIDEHLYWAVQPYYACYTFRGTLPAGIMEFDIRKEEFLFIPTPVPGPSGRSGPYIHNECDVNLLDIGGLLSLVWTTPECRQINKRLEVNIWTLKDRTTQLWTMSSYSIRKDPFWDYRRPMALVNDELVLHDSRKHFTCNLKLRTLRKFEGKRGDASFVTTHVMSLVSLRNCKSEIYMDNRGELEKNISAGVDENPVMISE